MGLWRASARNVVQRAVAFTSETPWREAAALRSTGARIVRLEATFAVVEDDVTPHTPLTAHCAANRKQYYALWLALTETKILFRPWVTWDALLFYEHCQVLSAQECAQWLRAWEDYWADAAARWRYPGDDDSEYTADAAAARTWDHLWGDPVRQLRTVVAAVAATASDVLLDTPPTVLRFEWATKDEEC